MVEKQTNLLKWNGNKTFLSKYDEVKNETHRLNRKWLQTNCRKSAIESLKTEQHKKIKVIWKFLLQCISVICNRFFLH